jgi:hypothetical protein
MLGRISMRSHDSAVSAVAGIAILLGITAGLAAVVWMSVSPIASQHHKPVQASGTSQFQGGAYTIKALGPDDIPLADGRLLLVLDGVPQTRPLTDLAPQLKDGKVWHAGETICLAGPPPCLIPNVKQVEAKVATAKDVVFSFPPLTSPPISQSPVFGIAPGGGLDLLDASNVRADIIGTSLTYGAGGPAIPITTKLSMDGGDTYEVLFSGHSVVAGDDLVMTGLSAGPRIGMQALASYGTFNALYDSLSGDPHVMVLKDGDSTPNKAAFGGQAPLASFLAPYVDTQTKEIVLQANQAILLFEFSPDVTLPAADFQDLVVLFTFT